MRKHRIIGGILLLVALGAAYTGYWFWLARTFEQNLALWVDQQRAMGYRMSYSAGEPSGFPLPVRIRVADVIVEAPVGHPPWRFDTASMRLGIAPWSPLTLHIDNEGTRPGYRLQWVAATRDYDLSVEGLSLALRLPTQGERLAVEIKRRNVSVSENASDIAWINHLAGYVEFAAARSHDESSIRFDLSADGIDFPMPAPAYTVETYFWSLSGRLMGQLPEEPIPSALAAWSSEGGYLELTQFKANWEGTTRVSIEGSGALDSQLQPVASMTAQLHNYPELIDWLVTIGALTSSQATATKLALAAMSRPDADGRMEARVPLTIQNGYVSVGAMKIAQIPRIEWQ